MLSSLELSQVARGAVGLIFLAAAVTKAFHTRAFADHLAVVLRAYGPRRSAGRVTHTLSVSFVGLELVIGGAIAFTESRIALLLAISMVLVGTFWHSLSVLHGDVDRCRCFLFRTGTKPGAELRSLDGLSFLSPVVFVVRNTSLLMVLLALLGASAGLMAACSLLSFVCTSGALLGSALRARSQLGRTPHHLEPVLASRMESVILVEWARNECYGAVAAGDPAGVP